MNVRLADFVVSYDDAIPRSLCQEIVRTFEGSAAEQHANGAGVRDGLEHSAWTEINVTRMADPAFQQFFEGMVLEYFSRYNALLKLSCPISPVNKLNDLMMKRYRASSQERFQTHFDSIRQHCNRYLVFLWYLNDVEVGGETWFPELELKISPKAGRLLMFPPYWMFQHAGLAPVSNDKYIISTYAVY